MASRLLLCLAVFCFFSFSRSDKNIATKFAAKDAVVAPRQKRSTGYYYHGDEDSEGGYYDYERDYYGDYYDYRSEYDYGRTRRGGYGYGRRDYKYGGYEGRGRRRSYFPRYRHDYYGDYEGPLHRSFRTPRTQTADRTLPSTHDNNVQMSLSYICNTKMQSKDEGQGRYAQPGARKAEGGEGYDGSGQYNVEPLYHSHKGGYSSSDSSSSSEGSKSSRLYIRRPRYDEFVLTQHIGPNMDISCSGIKPNFL